MKKRKYMRKGIEDRDCIYANEIKQNKIKQNKIK